MNEQEKVLREALTNARWFIALAEYRGGSTYQSQQAMLARIDAALAAPAPDKDEYGNPVPRYIRKGDPFTQRLAATAPFRQGLPESVPNSLIAAPAQMLLSWMDETFGNDDGLDWQDGDAAAVGDALNKAVANFKRIRAALAAVPQPAEPITLERWGKADLSSGLLLQRREDGYWTPWHLAEEALRAAPAATVQPIADIVSGEVVMRVDADRLPHGMVLYGAAPAATVQCACGESTRPGWTHRTGWCAVKDQEIL